MQNTKDVVMYDTKSKVSRLIGTVGDAVLALDIVDKQTREDLEEAKEANFMVTVVDDSEVISIFDTDNKGSVKPKAVASQRIKDAKGFPKIHE